MNNINDNVLPTYLNYYICDYMNINLLINKIGNTQFFKDYLLYTYKNKFKNIVFNDLTIEDLKLLNKIIMYISDEIKFSDDNTDVILYDNKNKNFRDKNFYNIFFQYRDYNNIFKYCKYQNIIKYYINKYVLEGKHQLVVELLRSNITVYPNNKNNLFDYVIEQYKDDEQNKIYVICETFNRHNKISTNFVKFFIENTNKLPYNIINKLISYETTNENYIYELLILGKFETVDNILQKDVLNNFKNFYNLFNYIFYKHFNNVDIILTDILTYIINRYTIDNKEHLIVSLFLNCSQIFKKFTIKFIKTYYQNNENQQIKYISEIYIKNKDFNDEIMDFFIKNFTKIPDDFIIKMALNEKYVFELLIHKQFEIVNVILNKRYLNFSNLYKYLGSKNLSNTDVILTDILTYFINRYTINNEESSITSLFLDCIKVFKNFVIKFIKNYFKDDKPQQIQYICNICINNKDFNNEIMDFLNKNYKEIPNDLLIQIKSNKEFIDELVKMNKFDIIRHICTITDFSYLNWDYREYFLFIINVKLSCKSFREDEFFELIELFDIMKIVYNFNDILNAFYLGNKTIVNEEYEYIVITTTNEQIKKKTREVPKYIFNEEEYVVENKKKCLKSLLTKFPDNFKAKNAVILSDLVNFENYETLAYLKEIGLHFNEGVTKCMRNDTITPEIFKKLADYGIINRDVNYCRYYLAIGRTRFTEKLIEYGFPEVV